MPPTEPDPKKKKQITRMIDMRVDDVSLVRQGAVGANFILLKTAAGGHDMAKKFFAPEVLDALGEYTPSDNLGPALKELGLAADDANAAMLQGVLLLADAHREKFGVDQDKLSKAVRAAFGLPEVSFEELMAKQESDKLVAALKGLPEETIKALREALAESKDGDDVTKSISDEKIRDEVKKALDGERKAREKLEKDLQKERKDRALENEKKDLAKFDRLAIDADKLAKAIVEVSDDHADVCALFKTHLQAANEALEMANVFVVNGEDGGGKDATAWEKLVAKAKAKLEADTTGKMTLQKAIVAVRKENPDLYDDYLKEKEAR